MADNIQANNDAAKARELQIQRQIAFVAGLFQGDATVRTLLESLAEGVVVINCFGIVMLVNAHSERLFGYTREEMIGQPLSMLLPERYREIHEQHVARFFREPTIRTLGQNLDLSGRRRDGTVFPVEIGLSFIETVTGRLAMAFITDITLRKEAEKTLTDRNQELEAFVYSVSHDLRSPLRVISGFCELLQEEYGERLDETGRDYLFRVTESARKMNLLIDDLLYLSRLSQQEMNLSLVNLSEIAQNAIEELRGSSPGRRVSVEIAPDVTAYADARLMGVVLTNLLGNAWKFTGKTERAHIVFGSYAQDAKTVYFVKDNGAGFDGQFAEKMFLPFQRLHSDRQFEGTGIGLAIVERVVRRHGGKIWAEGEVDKGASVYFTLRN
jgi:PAS domain S-box-containing protein